MSEKPDAPTSSSTDTTGIGSGNGAPKATIKNVDMTEEMQQEAVEIASVALEKYNIEKDIAAQIKKEFDRRHGPTWHVVVGKNFGSYVTHGMSTLVKYCIAAGSSVRAPAACSCLVLARLFLYVCRNQTLHLLLRRLPRPSHLEVIESRSLVWLRTYRALGWKVFG